MYEVIITKNHRLNHSTFHQPLNHRLNHRLNHLHANTFDHEYEKLDSMDNNKIEIMVEIFDDMKLRLDDLMNIRSRYINVEFRQYENDFHDGGMVGQEKNEKRVSDMLYCLATNKTEFSTAQCAGNDSQAMAAEQTNGAFTHYSRTARPNQKSYSMVNIGPRETFKLTSEEYQELLSDQKRQDMLERCTEWVLRTNKKRSMGSPLFTCIFPPLHNFAEHFSMFIPPLLQYIIIQGLRG
eukprot:393812_1